MSDGIIRQLHSIGVDPDAGDGAVKYGVHRAGSGSPVDNQAASRRGKVQPLVSCLMVTRGNLEILKYSLHCYRRQTYANRELVVVADAANARSVEDFLGRNGVGTKVLGVPRGLTLGDRRNMSIARARGDILMTWDDDDLSDPGRIAAAVAVLKQTEAVAAFLARWLIWWPERGIAAISGRRIWEGSMAIWRDHAPAYPARSHGEDSAAMRFLDNPHLIALIDAPLHYVYVVTGENTWDAKHFEVLFSEADRVFQGEDFRDLTRLLSNRLPLLDYEAQLRRA